VICRLCKRKAKVNEWFYGLSWKQVDEQEYEARKSDGRSTSIPEVCLDCLDKYNGELPKSLQELNEERKLLNA